MASSDSIAGTREIPPSLPPASDLAREASPGRPRLRALLEYPQLRFLQPLLDALAGAVCILNKGGTIIAINAAWQRFAIDNHFSGEDYGLGMNYFEICQRATGMCEKDAAAVAQGIHEVQAGSGDQFRFDYACSSPLENRWFQMRVTRMEGLGEHFSLVVHDSISEVLAKVARAGLEDRQAQQRLQLTSPAASAGVWEWDLRGGAVYWSEEHYSLWGIDPDSPPPTFATWAALVHPEERKNWVQAFHQALKNDAGVMSVEFRIIHPQRGLCWLNVIGQRFVDCEGKLERMTGITLDITARKLAEQALRASQDRFSKTFHFPPVPMTISTLSEGRYLDVNDSFLELTGLRREEVLGHTAEELQLWLVPEDRRKLLEIVSRGGSFRDVEFKFRTRTNQTCVGLVSGDLIEVDGEPCMLTLTRDITASEPSEEQVRQSQKMEAIGRLAGGIAHDFNNLLSVIIGCSEMLASKTHPADPRRKMAEEIQATGQRAAVLTRQLLAFSRQQVLELRVLDLNATVKDAESLLRRVIGENIRLSTRLAQSVGHVKADPGQLEVVILNLAVNARDAMPLGGDLTLETSNAEADEAFLRRHPYVCRGSYVVLRVSDTGEGIEDNHVEHIFEPFFTTKEKGKGTGLGLATVYGIVKQSGGYIWTHTGAGKGTTFEIYLPRVEAEAGPATPPDPPVTQLRGEGTILLVEDEDALRNLTRDFLRQSGYTVLEAATPAQAEEIARGYAGKLDLLLTDVVLSEGNGRELAGTLRPLRQEMKILYVSGYTDDTIFQLGGLEQGAAFLQKPFTLAVLARKVREILKLEGTS